MNKDDFLTKFKNDLEQYDIKNIITVLLSDNPNSDLFLNFLMSRKNKAHTIINHIMPVSHYLKWNKIKVHKNYDKRNLKAKLYRSNKLNYSETSLQKFMSGKYLFTQYFEDLLIKFPSSIQNNLINSEKIQLLDNIYKRIESKEILYFYLYQKLLSNESNNDENEYGKSFFDLQCNPDLHPKRIESIEIDFKKLTSDIYHTGLYISLLKARLNFYLIFKDDIEKVSLNIMKEYKENISDYNQHINSLFTYILFRCFFACFLNSIKNIDEKKIYFYYHECKSIFYKKQENFSYSLEEKNKFIDKVIFHIDNIDNKQSYIQAFINSDYIDKQKNYYSLQQKDLSYLTLFSNIALKTREIPYLEITISVEDIKRICNNNNIEYAKLNKENYPISFIPYSPQILIISSIHTVCDWFFNTYLSNPDFIFNFYNELLENDSDDKKLSILENIIK